MNNPSLVLECQGLSKTFSQGNQITPVLREVNLQVAAGQSIAIVGASGSGKSTLLHLLGGLDNPSAGSVHLQGQNLAELNQTKRGYLRNQALGFVYQFHHLLPEFTALENVAMPLLIRGEKKPKAYALAAEVLDAVGLSHRLSHKPNSLSGGERQRTAIARALVTQPACVLADEPTGNLDRSTAQQVFDLFLQLKTSFNTSVVMVTHDPQLAAQADCIYTMNDGILQAG